MRHFTVKDYTHTHNPGIHSAVATIQRGNGQTTENSGLYTGSGQSGEDVLHPPAAPSSYKESFAKSGTTLNPTVQQDYTGSEQLTLAGDTVKVRLSSATNSQEVTDCASHDVRQVSMDGGQLPMSMRCGSWAIISECSTGHHRFGKRLLCGHEWCVECGQDGSAAHKRRQARLLPKVQQVTRLGYFVIQIPKAYRKVGRGGVNPDIDEAARFACPSCRGIHYWRQGRSKVCARCHPAVDDAVVIEGGGDGRIRGWCYSRGDLRDTTSTILDVLRGTRTAGGRGSKRVGGVFGRGLARWHWFGDKVKGSYNPHLNVLVDCDSLLGTARATWQSKVEDYLAQLKGKTQSKATMAKVTATEAYLRGDSGYLPKPVLDAIKASLREALNCPTLVVHYSYKDKPGQLVQTVRYVTRATFRNYEWNEYMARELWGFRNTRWWGSWNGEAAWQLTQAGDEGADVEGLTAIDKLESGVCPCCGQPLRILHYKTHKDKHGVRRLVLKDGKPVPVRWTKPVDARVSLDAWRAVEIAGTGYYRIPACEPNPDILTPDDIFRLQQSQEVDAWVATLKVIERDSWALGRGIAARDSNGDGLSIEPKVQAVDDWGVWHDD